MNKIKELIKKIGSTSLVLRILVGLVIGVIFSDLFSSIVSNPLESLSNGNYIAILFWAIVIGIALKGASETTKTFMDKGRKRSAAVASQIESCMIYKTCNYRV